MRVYKFLKKTLEANYSNSQSTTREASPAESSLYILFKLNGFIRLVEWSFILELEICFAFGFLFGVVV